MPILFFGGGTGSPSNRIWPGPRPTYKWHLDGSNLLVPIHQRYRTGGHRDTQTDRDRQTDNGPIEPFHKRSPNQLPEVVTCLSVKVRSLYTEKWFMSVCKRLSSLA